MTHPYRFTPGRAMALKKARNISARNRSQRVSQGITTKYGPRKPKTIAVRKSNKKKIIAGAVVGLAVAGGATIYVHNIRMNKKRIPTVGKELVHIPGLGSHTVNLDAAKRRPRANPTVRQSGPATVWKVSPVNSETGKSTIVKTTKRRMIYDSRRRRAYWRAKPVGGRK